MSFIAKNPLSLPEIEHTPSTPSGTRGLFAGKDGWYDVDTKGTKRKLVFGDDVRNEIQAIKSLQYYGDANIVPSDASLFEFTVDDTTMTASITAKSNDISGDIIIPYECNINDKTYKITDISDNAFLECFSLTKIVIPNSVIEIGEHAFFNCRGLTNINIPNSVTTIKRNAFAICIGLTSLTIPDKVSRIEDETFYFCEGLISVKIPNSVTSIGKDAFLSCSFITDVYYEGTQKQWEVIGVGEGNNCLIDATIHYEWSDVTKEYVKEQIDKAVIQGGSTVVDAELDLNSENPVQNKVITSKINEVNNRVQIALDDAGNANELASQNRGIIEDELKPNIATALSESGQAYIQVSEALTRIDILQLEKADVLYVDEKIGDIDNALENIIAIQNSLIGGDTE
jgi:hypothetical protein